MKCFNLVILLLNYNCIFSQNNVRLIGTSKIFNDGTKVFLSNHTIFNGISKVIQFEDSTVINNKKFQFKIKSKTPEFYNLKLYFNGRLFSTKIFLESGVTKINLLDSSLVNIRINNKASNDYITYLNEIKKIKAPPNIKNAWLEFEKYKLIKDTLNANEILKVIQHVNDSLGDITYQKSIQWVRNNPYSKINSFVLYYSIKPYAKREEVKEIYANFPASLKNNSFAKEIDFYISELLLGSKIPGFILYDSSDNIIQYKEIKGKVILIDFWASWCIPCRKKNIELIDLYDKYKIYGFEIVSISLDNVRNLWTNAITEDKMKWINVSDLKGWKSELIKDYLIQSIPYNILVNNKGIIIAKNVWGSQIIPYLIE